MAAKKIKVKLNPAHPDFARRQHYSATAISKEPLGIVKRGSDQARKQRDRSVVSQKERDLDRHRKDYSKEHTARGMAGARHVGSDAPISKQNYKRALDNSEVGKATHRGLARGYRAAAKGHAAMGSPESARRASAKGVFHTLQHSRIQQAARPREEPHARPKPSSLLGVQKEKAPLGPLMRGKKGGSYRISSGGKKVYTKK